MVELHEDWLRLHFSSVPKAADFHYLWLRHNADTDRHPITGERILDSSEIADEIHPLRAEVEGERLAVAWSDGTQSQYELSWLQQHAYAPDREAVPPPPSQVSAVELSAAGLHDADALAVEALRVVRTHGLVVVRGFRVRTPEEDTDVLIDAFERAGQRIIETHFGRIEDLRPDNTTNQNTDQLGYTDSRIDLHTDQPFLDRPPRYQLLQAIVTAEKGGENFIVDAEAAARFLEARDARDFELLTSTPVRFHRKQKSFERVVTSPVLQPRGRPDDGGFLVRFSYFTMAPHQVPFATMLAWYRAYNHFTRLVREERHQYRFKLEPGDFVLYDNHRMLHGRTGFSGARWLRGIYLDPAPQLSAK